MHRPGRSRRLTGRLALPERRRWLAVYRDVLSSAGDAGVVVVDTGGRVRLWNEAAARLLGAAVPPGTPLGPAPHAPSGAVSRAPSGAASRAPSGAASRAPSGMPGVPLLAPEIAGLIADDRTGADESAVILGRSLQVTRRPVIHRGRTVGRVIFLRDRTETLRLAAQLDAEREATIALRARAHEADNRLHTVVSLVELGHVQQAVDFATAVLARSREMHESIHSTVADPVLAALLMGKAVRADEAGVALHVDPATTVPSTGLPSQDLVLLLGNLIDNGIDAAAATPPPRWVHLLVRTSAESVRLEVSDSGPGVPPDSVYEAFRPGWTTKTRSDPGQAHGQGLGLALVAEALQRLGGNVTVDRWVGARFVVEVPLLADRAAPDAARHDTAPAGRHVVARAGRGRWSAGRRITEASAK